MRLGLAFLDEVIIWIRIIQIDPLEPPLRRAESSMRLSASNLASVGERDTCFPLPHGRGDNFHHGSPTPDPRGLPKGWRTRDIYIPDLQIDTIKVTTRDFR